MGRMRRWRRRAWGAACTTHPNALQCISTCLMTTSSGIQMQGMNTLPSVELTVALAATEAEAANGEDAAVAAASVGGCMHDASK